MSEATVLSLVARSPATAALSRRVRPPLLFPVLRRLEERGYVRRRRDEYLLTARGRRELELERALRLATARALAAR